MLLNCGTVSFDQKLFLDPQWNEALGVGYLGTHDFCKEGVIITEEFIKSNPFAVYKELLTIVVTSAVTHWKVYYQPCREGQSFEEFLISELRFKVPPASQEMVRRD